MKNEQKKQAKRAYYVEFTVPGADAPYALQTEWVDSVEKALDLIAAIDFVDPEQIQISIMYADWDEEDDCYGDIDVYSDVTISDNQIELSNIKKDGPIHFSSHRHINYEQLANGLIDDMCNAQGVRETIDILANSYGFGIKELKQMNFDQDDIDVVVGHKVDLGYKMLNYITTVASCGMYEDELYAHILPNLGFTVEDCKKIKNDVFDDDSKILETFYKLITQISGMMSEDEFYNVLKHLGFSDDDFEDFVS